MSSSRKASTTSRTARRGASEVLGKRPHLTAEESLARRTKVLAVTMTDLQNQRKGGPVVWARGLLAVPGVERCGLRVKDLARGLQQLPDTVSKAIGRAARRETDDQGYRQQLDELDKSVIESSPAHSTNTGEMV